MALPAAAVADMEKEAEKLGREKDGKPNPASENNPSMMLPLQQLSISSSRGISPSPQQPDLPRPAMAPAQGLSLPRRLASALHVAL